MSNPLVELMVGELPASFVVALQQALPNIYQEAYQQAFSQPLWEKSEGRYLVGHLRHALFEAQFRNAAREAGLKTGLTRVPIGSYEYSYVRAGKLLLTASALPSEDDIVRPAFFRQQHALVNHFLSNPTLPIIDPPDLTSVDTIYGIVIHVPYAEDKAQCSYAGIAIPNEGTTEWVEQLSLADLSKAQAQATQAKPETTEDRAHPRKKDEGQRKKEGSGNE